MDVLQMKVKSLFILFLVALSLFGSGCADEELTAEQIIDKMLDAQVSIEDYSATVYTNVSYGGYCVESETEIIKKNPDTLKRTVKTSEDTALVTILKKDTMISYDTDSNIAYSVEGEWPPEMFELDFVGFLNESNVSLVGTDKFDDKDVYIIEIHLEKFYAITYSDILMWVDKETWMPLKVEYIDDGSPILTEEYKNIRINTSIDDEEFELPESIELKDFKEDFFPTELSSLEQLRELSKFDILLPSYLPDGFEFESATLDNSTIDKNTAESITITYYNRTDDSSYVFGDDEITIYEIIYVGDKEEKKEYSGMANTETVLVNGEEGILLTISSHSRILEWDVGNVKLLVSSGLEKDKLIKIAESMG